MSAPTFGPDEDRPIDLWPANLDEPVPYLLTIPIEMVGAER